MESVHQLTCEKLEQEFKNEQNKNSDSTDDDWKKTWCEGVGDHHRDCETWKTNCNVDNSDDSSVSDVNESTDNLSGSEHFSIMNDNKSMNSILVFGLFVILFLFVYIYGFHGILKFEKNLNYLIAILFSGLGIILSIVLIIGTIRHVSSNTMNDEEKANSRNGLLVIIVLIIFFSMMAVIRYNYGKLFNALNKTLPANKSSRRGRKKGR
tara:strand:+ start:314 stop:940 length:627 start_codon:yes stop_codon:yes gene_type:complete